MDIPREMAEPPESGTLDFFVPLAPISQQAASAQKASFRIKFQQHVPATKFLFSGDVMLEIEWMVHERSRYEADTAPDVDNILKPLMDALCGPKSLLIDDNQVQSVMCSWIDWTSESEQLNLRIRFTPDEFVSKDGLIFVEFRDALCMPMNKNLPREDLAMFVSDLKHQLDTRSKWSKRGYDYHQTRAFLSVQRLFHRSRVNGFEVVPYKMLLEQSSPPSGA